MSQGEVDVTRQVVALVRELSAATVEQLSSELTRADVEQRKPISSVPGPLQGQWASLARSAAALGIRPGQLACLLRGASAMDAEWRSRTSCEVAWTGPTPPLSNLRRTEQALLEVITSARRVLWVVSFAAYRVRSICEALVAAGRRCDVRLVLESEIESDGRLSSGGIDEMPHAVRQSCHLLVWPREKRVDDDRGRFGLLHAKCAVADGELLFIGSANLTESAFELNMEIGAVIRGRGPATVVQEQLEWLRNSGHLAPV